MYCLFCSVYFCVVACIVCFILCIFVLFYVLSVLFYVFLCCFMYCLFVLCIFLLFFFLFFFSLYFCVVLCIVCFVLCIFVLLYIVCFVSFCLLFVCICVLYYCHGMANQLQLNISYHACHIDKRIAKLRHLQSHKINLTPEQSMKAQWGSRGTRCWWCSWLRHCAASRKVTDSIPYGLTGVFHWHNLCSSTRVLRPTHPLT
jgi:hypothetical protein